MFYAYMLDTLTLLISICGFVFWFFIQRLVKKRKVEMGVQIEKGIIISMLVLNIIVFLIYFFTQEYIAKNLIIIRKCRDDFGPQSSNPFDY